MAVRIKKDGRILCAATSLPEDGDVYIDDNIHYYLSSEKRILITSVNHISDGGQWWWKGQEPKDVIIDSYFYEEDDNDTIICHCSGDELGTHSEEVMVPIPKHMEKYEKGRVIEGLSKFICIDYCILPEIKYLWSLGIVTYGCCCGHNQVQSMVSVDDKDIDKMLELGYVQNNLDLNQRGKL